MTLVLEIHTGPRAALQPEIPEPRRAT